MSTRRLTTILGSTTLACAVLLGGATASSAQTPTARYEVEFEGNWSAVTHPTDYPTGGHFSPLVGALHNAGVDFWESGALASPGIKAMAEMGMTTPLDVEIDAAIAAGTAGQPVFGPGVDGTATEVVNFTATTAHPQLTLVTMVAPSPDWFVGVGGVDLIQNGDWVNELVIDLFAWDAGTDSGASFLSPDEVTVPPDPISLLTGGPPTPGVRMARLTITRLDTPPVCDVEMSQTSYADGELVEISAWTVSNPGVLPIATELKMWARIVGDEPYGLSSLGADGSLVIDAGASVDVGTVPLFTVSPAIPISAWEVGCRLMDPATGEERNLDLAPFVIDP